MHTIKSRALRTLDAANPWMHAEAAFVSAEKSFAGFREADCRWHEAASGGGIKGNQLYRSCMVEQTRSRLGTGSIAVEVMWARATIGSGHGASPSRTSEGAVQ
jgi:hypothetical protein